MTLHALIVLPFLFTLLLLIQCFRSLRRGRMLRGIAHAMLALLILTFGLSGLAVAWSLRGYQPLSSEERVGELRLSRVAYHEYIGAFTSRSGERSDFVLRGDEWQIDAKVLKWPAWTASIGFPSDYRLDRISGRYNNLDDERRMPRTVYAFSPPYGIDPWDLIERFHAWIPWIDAFYGSATFMPLADGADYEIEITPTGPLARPTNEQARAAVADWH